MKYEEYINKFRGAQLDDRLSDGARPWTEAEFNEFMKPITETPLSKDQNFKLKYSEIYLRVRRIIEKRGTPEQLQELDDIYHSVEEKINL